MDDDSPDGTAELARDLASRTERNIRVVQRTEEPGLSKSVVRGFEEAEGDTVMVMDADLQHPPEKIPEFLDRLSDDSPVVVGTRYREGGDIEGWSRFRKTVSRGAITIGKILIPEARRSSDPVSGFFAVKKDALDLERLSPHGYKILLDVLTTVDPENVPEVGYHFSDRESGESKLDIHEYVKFLEHGLECRMKHHGLDRKLDTRRTVRFLEFAGVGASGVAINSAIFLGTSALGLHYLLRGFLAFAGAVQWNFLWNWLVTFDRPEDRLLNRYLRFNAVSLGGFAVYETLLFILIGLLGLWEAGANIAAIFGGFLWNFLGSEKLAFKRFND